MKYGVAGYPLAFQNSEIGKKRELIFQWLSKLGLDALELQMTYGPRTKPENCLILHNLSQEFNIKLSVHASYFIVLTSEDDEKINRSIDTLARTYDLANILGAKEIILHPGPLYGKTSEEPKNNFLENCNKFLDSYGKTDIGLFIETAGKTGQLGSVEEILDISQELDGVHPCIDWGHVHARTLGTLETPENIKTLGDQLINFLSKNPDKRIHFHYTPIHYGPKGEIKHRAIHDKYPLEEQYDLLGRKVGTGSIDGYYHPRFTPVAEQLNRFPENTTVISETHNTQEEGALALKSASSSCK